VSSAGSKPGGQIFCELKALPNTILVVIKPEQNAIAFFTVISIPSPDVRLSKGSKTYIDSAHLGKN